MSQLALSVSFKYPNYQLITIFSVLTSKVGPHTESVNPYHTELSASIFNSRAAALFVFIADAISSSMMKNMSTHEK